MAFEWMNQYSRLFMSRGYLSEGQEGEDRVHDISTHFQHLNGDEEKANKFFHYMGKGFYSLSSPVWSNYGTNRGLPVSCFGSYIEDSIASILATHSEVGAMSKFGGGCSGYFGDIRPRGAQFGEHGETFGPVHFMEMFDTLSSVVSQGSVRRGFFSAYLPIEHQDAEEFIGIGGDGHRIQGITHGITVGDEWMKSMIDGDMDKRKLWAKVLQQRKEIGYPYIIFRDNMNNYKPDVYKDKDMEIVASNMCSEIALPSSPDESFVCVLSSMNLEKYDEWKDTDAVEILTYFLDTVVTEFINRMEEMYFSIKKSSHYYDNHNLPIMMERAITFARKHRALGIGTLGWHSYLQKNMIPFESREAAKLNVEVHSTINERAHKASQELAKEFGESTYLKGYGRRNTTLTAIAPTKSSSFILGQVSQGIEPETSNFYIKDLAKIKARVKNRYLEEALDKIGMNTEEVWDSIKKRDGSVQHLDIPDYIKEVFKTFAEINPTAIISQAASRQPYVDQAQSLNLMIGPSVPVKDVNQLYINAWQMGVKSLYYQYNVNAAQEFARGMNILECSACEA